MTALEDTAVAMLAALPAGSRVLELGCLRWEPDRPTHHARWIPAGVEHVKSDVTAGVDVDVPADAHDLAPFPDESFDAIVACSVWEHLERPWIAATAARRALKPGGFALIDTHQTFPIHGYPHDYFRFTTEAMGVLFGDGWETIDSGYAFPCHIDHLGQMAVWNDAAEAFLNVQHLTRRAER